MSQIFISYANEDTDFARRLADAFEIRGWSVWWDKQIPPGMDYAQVIESAVNAAQCVVVLWSKHSIQSRWVQTEAAAGADRHIIATVIVDEIDGDQIPFEFRRLQAVNLSDWTQGHEHQGFERLAQRIGSILDAPPRPVEQTSRPADAGPTASWMDALTTWGSGKQRGYRIGAVFSALLGLGACSEALDWGDPDMFLASFFLLGLAGYLIHLGRKAA